MAVAVPVSEVSDEKAVTKRFYRLVHYLKDCGVCGLCAAGMAIADIEKRKFQATCQRKVRHVSETCAEVARRSWSMRPRGK